MKEVCYMYMSKFTPGHDLYHRNIYWNNELRYDLTLVRRNNYKYFILNLIYGIRLNQKKKS